MCLLSISTGIFLLVAFAALCVYELGVFLYFRFVKGDDSGVSKNEARKRRERVQDSPKHTPETRTVTSKRVKESRRKGDVPDWEDLIDYRKTNHATLSESVSGVRQHRSPVIDVFSPADTHADFSRMDELNRESVEDLLGNASPSVADVVEPVQNVEKGSVLQGKDVPMDQEPVPGEYSSQRPSSAEGEGSSFDVNTAFPEFDCSNMLG